MTEWWNSLSDPAQIFWLIAIMSSIIQILMFAMSFIGSHDFDHGSNVGDSIEGVKLVSFRAIIAFFVGFGWTGALMLGRGAEMMSTIAASLAVGVVFMLVIFAIMRVMMSLRADGTLDYQNAIGLVGHVYVTIPASRKGQGQVEILLQGRLATVSAVTKADQPLTQNTPVTVTSVENGNLLVVTPNI
jgi:membrane protein implicated in regulation of membrane protease activity